MAINNRIVGSIKQILQSYIFGFNPIPYKPISFELPSKAGLWKARKQALILKSILLIKEPQLKKGDRVYLSTKNLKILALSKKFDSKKVRPFTINKILRPIIYKLKLSLNIGIYLVFYQSLLEPIINKEAIQGGYWKFEQKKPQEFIIDKILRKQGQQYLVKQRGYLYLENIQELVKNLKNCQQKL